MIDIKNKDLLNINCDTQKTGSYTKNDYIHEDVDLERNIPVYNAFSNNKGDEKVSYIHEDIYLDRNLPEYNAATNLREKYQKTLEHEYMQELTRNMPLANANTNQRTSGESNISSTQFRLNQKIHAGGFDGKGKIPTLNRMQNVREAPESERTKMLKNVNNQFEGRYQSNKFPNNF